MTEQDNRKADLQKDHRNNLENLRSEIDKTLDTMNKIGSWSADQLRFVNDLNAVIPFINAQKELSEVKDPVLKAHIDEINKNAGTLPLSDNPEHWAEYGITSPEQLDDYLDVQAYRNVYKNEHGVNPGSTTPEDARRYLEQDLAKNLTKADKPKPQRFYRTPAPTLPVRNSSEHERRKDDRQTQSVFDASAKELLTEAWNELNNSEHIHNQFPQDLKDARDHLSRSLSLVRDKAPDGGAGPYFSETAIEHAEEARSLLSVFTLATAGYNDHDLEASRLCDRGVKSAHNYANHDRRSVPGQDLDR